MKKLFTAAVIMMAMLFSVNLAQATPKDSGVLPKCDANYDCVMPTLPNGKLLVVEIYNDYTNAKIRYVEQANFHLDPGDSTNHTWSDGNTWYGYIDTTTPVPDGLVNDCRRPDGCKWLRVPPWEKNTAKVMLPGSVFTPKP